MEEITRNDFSFFQNEVLKDIKTLENKVNEKISTILKTVNNTSLILNQKYENSKIKMDEILQTLDPEKIMDKINERLDKFNTKLQESTLVTNTKLSSFERDLSNACFKYDRIFLNNISSPGLIGDGCPYQTMRSFLEFMNNKIKELMSTKERNTVDFKKYNDFVKTTLDKFREEINENKNSNYNFLVKEIKQYDKRTIEKIKAVEDRLSFIKIENGRYNFNLNKKWEELEDKLKLFINMNDNLINVYNNNRNEFLQVKKKFNDLSDYLKDMKYNKNNINVKCLFDDLSKKIKINNKKSKRSGPESTKTSLLPSIDDISRMNPNKNHENSEQNFNFEIKPKGRLLKKKTFQLDNFGSSFNSKRNNNYNILMKTNTSNYNLINDNTNNNINKAKNMKFSFERKMTQNLDFSKNNIRAFNADLMNEQKRERESEPNSVIIKHTKSLREKSYNNFIENIKEQNKENSSGISEDNSQDNSDLKEKDKDNLQKKSINKNSNKSNTLSKSINKDKEKEKDNDIIKEISMRSSNSATIENKENIQNKSNNNLIYNKRNNINNLNNSNDTTKKIIIDEEINKVNERFNEIYDKMNSKIIEISDQLNKLIKTINKLIFKKEDRIKKIREIDLFFERKKKQMFLNNSGLCLPYSNNNSSDDKNPKKENNEKDNSFNLVNKNSRNIYKGKILFNNINRSKHSDTKTNSKDLMNLIKDGNKSKNYYIRMIDPLSINQIENYLIRKFTESN